MLDEVARLESLLQHAKRIPLTTQVRLVRDDLDQAVGALRDAGARAAPSQRSRVERPVTAIEAMARAARVVPLTPHVRVDAEQMRGELEELRRVVGASA